MGLSRRHAMVVRADNGYALVDLGSTNGTWLNDVRLMPNRLYPLRNGDQVRLGRLALSIYFYSAPVGAVSEKKADEADSSESQP
jgi:pSer/pThr/pTyr-binding forkhead associated (FHA) protein